MAAINSSTSVRLVPEQKRLVEVGDESGRLRIIGVPFLVPIGTSKSISHIVCECKCGDVIVIRQSSFLNEHTQSCGCFHSDVIKANAKHGMISHSLYRVWSGMIQRCENENSEVFGYYGACGISVCDEWKDSSAFMQWCLNNGWKPGLTIDRDDPRDGYHPGNCRFITMSQQGANFLKTKRKTTSRFKGVSKDKNGKWRAVVGLNYKQIFVGYFTDEIEAAKAYDTKAIELFGAEYARTNFGERSCLPQQKESA